MLQETPGEALARFVTDTVNLTFITRAINRGSAIGTAGFNSTTFDAATVNIR
ncbi:MAG: hypothetical protein ACC628_24950 [Pirellulaceae bacterium]